MKHIKQKIRSDKREFKIVDDGIIVDLNNVGHIQNYKVSFSDVGKDEYINIKKAHPLAWLFILSGILNVILLTVILTEFFQTSFEQGKWILMSAFALFIIIIGTLKEHFQTVEIKNLESAKALSFIYTKKYKSEVDGFISQIHRAQKEYFRKTYYRVDPILPFDFQKTRILWLYENKYIFENEYKVILDELENKRLIDGE